jgi:hypothetical protein
MGKAAIGVYRVEALWAVSGRAAPTVPLVEMAVALQKMPQSLSDPAFVDIAVSVDEGGRVDGCAPAEALSWAGQPIADRQQAARLLGGIPCAEALKSLKLEAAKTDKGQPVRSVQTATVLFTADVPALVAGAAPKRDAPAGIATAAPPTPPADPDVILVEGRNISGVITRPDTIVPPAPGFHPFKDLTVIGNDVVLLEAWGEKFYRATLVPHCFGTSSLTGSREGVTVDDPSLKEFLPPESGGDLGPGREPSAPGLLQEGLAFVTHADGSFDRSSIFIARVIEADQQMHVKRCEIESLVESKPPVGWKRSSRSAKPIKPPPPLLAARPPATAPDGGPVYPVEWVERPTQNQLDKIAGGRPGTGWIMCQTTAGDKVRNCRTVGESPERSGLANQMKLASRDFRVKPPTVEGRPAIGAWVAIGFDFSLAAKRRTVVKCDPKSKLDPC